MANGPTRSQLKKNLKALRERLEEKPMDLDARMRMARTHRLLGDKRDAVDHYRSVARYLSLSGTPLRAIAVLKELLLVDHRHEETLLFLAKLYARTRSADFSNRGRIAVPILSDDSGPLALPEGLPLTATGLWRAIRPQSTDVFAVVHAPTVDSAHEKISLADELRALDDAYELDEDDVLEERTATDDDPPPGAHPDPKLQGAPSPWASSPGRAAQAGVDVSPAASAPAPVDLSDAAAGADGDDAKTSPSAPDPFDYEMLGPVATEDIVLPKVQLFSSLSPAAFIELGHAMVFQRAKAGEIVFSEGDPGDSCIVISRGRATAFRERAGDDVVLKELGEGDFAGVFALVAERPRQASLRAETDLEFFEIDRLAIRDLVDKHPSVQGVLQDFSRERLLLNLLGALPVFSALTSKEREDVAKLFSNKTYETDDELFWDHYARDGLWVILRGTVRIVDTGGTTLRTLGAGDYVGCLVQATEHESQCSAIAGEETEVAVLTHRPLGDLLKAHPDLGRVREAFSDLGLMLDEAVFANSPQLSTEPPE